MVEQGKPIKKTALLPAIGGPDALDRLSRLYDIVRSLNSFNQLDKLLNQIVASGAEMLEARGGSLLLLDPEGNKLTFEVTSGRSASQFRKRELPVDKHSVEGSIALRVAPLIENNIEGSNYLIGQAGPMGGYKARRMVGVPMKAQDRLMGVLVIHDKVSGAEFNRDDMQLLETLADAAVVAIENVRLYEEERNQAKQLSKAFDDLDKVYRATLQALTGLLDIRDEATHGHSIRVVAFTLRLAREMGITDPVRLRSIEQGALLHDVGKIGVADAILRKQGALTENEWEEMRSHPMLGYRMLKDIEFLSDALSIVRYHHERWNGTGYPHGLAREKIPLEARIFAVADAFDAITSERPYSKARTYEEAAATILQESGEMFDPDVVVAFLRVPKEEWLRVSDAAVTRQLTMNDLLSVGSDRPSPAG
jgi:putative nucleotidyltransferase with HDIG domain